MKSEDNLIVNKIFTSCYNVYFIQSMGKVFVIFVEICMKGTLLSTVKGNNWTIVQKIFFYCKNFLLMCPKATLIVYQWRKNGNCTLFIFNTH